MSVFKHKTRIGTWVAKFSYKDFTGKTRQKKREGFKTKRDAIKWEKEFLDKMNGGNSEMLFSSAVDIYYKDRELTLSPTTLKIKKSIVQTKILPYFNDKKLCDITSDDVNAWHRELKKFNLKSTYMRNIKNELNAILNYCVNRKILTDNPIKYAATIGDSKTSEMMFYTKDEFDKFIQQFDKKSQMGLVYRILFWTGLRIGELLALKPNDFDFENLTMRVDENCQVYEGEKILKSPKTFSSIRTINIPQKLGEDIKEYISKIYSIKDDDLIFDVGRSRVRKYMKIGAENAGLSTIRIHDLRHSHASMLLENGVDHMLIAKRLGHQDTTQFYKTYGHISKNLEMNFKDTLDRIYS